MDIRRFIKEELKKSDVEPQEINAETNFILRNFLDIENLYEDIPCTKEKIQKLKEIFSKRKKGMPIQYILNIADFMGEKFFVNENVLIPRAETEILVLKAMELAQKIQNPKILDIGSGSGCIAIMLSKKLPDSQIFSCDISIKALQVAKDNAKRLQSNVKFVQSDLFEKINEKFDIIISNPPYIPYKLKSSIQKEVQFEPKEALYARDEKGIEFYENIIKTARNYLTNEGSIIFELGIGQSILVKNLFVDYNYTKIEITKDLDNIERIISAKVKNG